MTDPARFTGQCMTFEEYRDLENAGRITRPLTDDPIGSDPSRRQTDAATSALHTTPDTAIPTDWTKPARPRTPPRKRRSAVPVPDVRVRDQLGRFAPHNAADETPAIHGPQPRQRAAERNREPSETKETA